MLGQNECKFFDKLEVLADLLCAGKIDNKVLDEYGLKYMEYELFCGNDWFVRHFDGTADYLLECDPNELGRPFDELAAHAEKEIALFRKYGYNDMADSMERMLNEAKDYANA